MSENHEANEKGNGSAKNKKSFFKERIYPIFFMVVITGVCISLVSGLYLSTRELVLLNEAIFERKAVLYTGNIDYPDDDPQGIEEIYRERVTERSGKKITNGLEEDARYFEITYPDGSQRYVVYVTGAGVWGDIVTLFGFTRDFEEIVGVEFTRHNETPGLGGRITETWFKEQFRSKRGPFTLVPEDADAGENEINAITGATGTSNAVLSIANRAWEKASQAVRGSE